MKQIMISLIESEGDNVGTYRTLRSVSYLFPDPVHAERFFIYLDVACEMDKYSVENPTSAKAKRDEQQTKGLHV